MEGDPNHEALRVVAVGKEQLELVSEDGHELHHLERGEVFLPPNILLVFGTHRSDHVIEVHHNVDKGIEQSKESAVAARGKFHSHPDGEWHASVMDDVEC